VRFWNEMQRAMQELCFATSCVCGKDMWCRVDIYAFYPGRV